MNQPRLSYSGLTTFYTVDETDASVGTYHVWSGYKAQPWPAASYDE